MWCVAPLAVVLVAGPFVAADSATDITSSRCSCKCPEAAFVDPDIKTDWAKRKVYINSTVAAADCDCEHVVVAVLGLDQEQIDKFCPRCLCVHETRSLLTIKVVVGIILWVLSLLLIYLVYLVCIEPMLGGSVTRSRRRGNYSQHQDEPTVTDDTRVTPEETPMAQYGSRGAASTVVNRLSDNQDRWRRQVEIQRCSVYDRHSLLN